MEYSDFNGIDIFESEEMFKYAMEQAEWLFAEVDTESDLGVVVRALNRKEIEDFNDIYDFTMSDKCREIVEFIDLHRGELKTGVPDSCKRLVDALSDKTDLFKVTSRTRWGNLDYTKESSINITDYSSLVGIIEEHRHELSREDLSRCSELYRIVIKEEALGGKY